MTTFGLRLALAWESPSSRPTRTFRLIPTLPRPRLRACPCDGAPGISIVRPVSSCASLLYSACVDPARQISTLPMHQQVGIVLRRAADDRWCSRVVLHEGAWRCVSMSHKRAQKPRPLLVTLMVAPTGSAAPLVRPTPEPSDQPIMVSSRCPTLSSPIRSAPKPTAAPS